MKPFADKFEEQAHGVICILKFGAVGGLVNTAQMRQVANFLRGGPLPSPVVVVKPVVSVVLPTPTIKVKLP